MKADVGSCELAVEELTSLAQVLCAGSSPSGAAILQKEMKTMCDELSALQNHTAATQVCV